MGHSQARHAAKTLGIIVALGTLLVLPGTRSDSQAGGETAAKSVLPNVVLILLDDVGYGDFKAYNGDSKIPLPHIDELAARGMVFTDAHSPAAVCAPTRYSVLTGNYPWRGREPWGTWRYNQASQILPGQTTLGDLMKRAGYHTSMFGKYHMGGHFQRKDPPGQFALNEEDYRKIDFSQRFGMGPRDLGFDYSFMLLSGIQDEPYAYFENDELVGDPARLGRVETSGASGIGMPYWKTDAVGPVMTRKALDFLERHFEEKRRADERRPFFVYYCSQAIHTPIKPASAVLGTPVRGQTFDRVGDFLFELDVTLGKLIEKIDEGGALANTLFIVTSDNGAWPHASLYAGGHDPIGGLAGWKEMIWEGGHRVPLIAAWGDGMKRGSPVPPGTRSDALVGLQDIYATLAELTGQALDANEALDSYSFLAALLGERSHNPRRWLMVQGRYYEEQNPRKLATVAASKGIPARMLRDREWKLIVEWMNATMKGVPVVGKPLGLYNLEADPTERNDLLDDRGQRRRIETMLQKYREIDASERSVPLIR
jgi:arylsulfatase A-like enzyme